MDDSVRPRLAHNRDESAKRDHLALRIADFKQADILLLHTEWRIGLRHHPPGAAKSVEIVDVKRAEVNLQRFKDVGERYPIDFAFTRSISTCNCGAFVWKLASILASSGVCIALDIISLCTFVIASNPSSARSSICNLKPPVAPSPGTGGGGRCQ